MCALVRGMTDILTPVNLMPNSNFGRGYVEPTLPALNSNYQEIIYDPSITCMYSSGATAITLNSITKRTEQLTIDFTLASDTQGMMNFRMPFNVTTGKYYTVRYKVLDNVGNFSSKFKLNIFNGNTTNTVYKNVKQEGNTYTLVAVIVGENNGQIELRLSNANSGTLSNTHFNFTIHDVEVFEGCFCNPPDTDSLDVRVNGQFVLTDRKNLVSSNYKLAHFNGNIQCHPSSDDIYENVLGLDITNSIEGVYQQFAHVRMMVYLHSGYTYTMSVADLDIWFMQYTQYGIPDCGMLNLKLNEVVHTNQSGTPSKVYTKIDNLRIQRDANNNRCFWLQAKCLNSTNNYVGTREATVSCQVYYESIGRFTVGPKSGLSNTIIYSGVFGGQ